MLCPLSIGARCSVPVRTRGVRNTPNAPNPHAYTDGHAKPDSYPYSDANAYVHPDNDAYAYPQLDCNRDQYY